MSQDSNTPQNSKGYIERPLYLEIKDVIDILSPKYGLGEAKAMSKIIFEHLKGWTAVDLAIKANEPISEYLHNKIQSIISRLLDDEPLQYIIGWADFYGMKLDVNPSVLIPRPETTELVDIIVRQNTEKDLRVLDFGTGSGCIAIALARNLRFPSVVAVDKSDPALKVAQDNARKLYANIDFVNSDILDLTSNIPPQLETQFDIIVSNPPYIANKEKAGMSNNVLLHEPASALFVPDSDPLIFYNAILHYATKHLSTNGTIYFEINPLFAQNMIKSTKQSEFSNIEILRDTEGKLRFAIIRR